MTRFGDDFVSSSDGLTDGLILGKSGLLRIDGRRKTTDVFGLDELDVPLDGVAKLCTMIIGLPESGLLNAVGNVFRSLFDLVSPFSSVRLSGIDNCFESRRLYRLLMMLFETK
jgi:hypothetical protein